VDKSPLDSAISGELEWNFDSIPENELIACCYWEYARESQFIRDVRQRCLNPKCREMVNTELNAYVGIDLEKIQSIGYASEVILRGFTQLPGKIGEASANQMPVEESIVPGSFPNPWQSLSVEERRSRSKIGSECAKSGPFKRGMTLDAENILDYAKMQRTQAEVDRQQVRREHPNLPDEALQKMGKLKYPEIKTSVWHEWGREASIIAIEWGQFTNDEIVNYFRGWVKANRPDQFPVPSQKGRKPKDWRAHLTRLAVLRLLAHFSPLELVDPRSNPLPSIWESQVFSGKKWEDVNKWYDARRESKTIFHKLFPFLPEDDLPLSWSSIRSTQ
jgi:hypothetical protein